ncbi:hypothetical protein [Fuscibacter oryzae]|uniref:Lipoprotein n=1 Tax=Fuscibacter oryzae TaxID=2803939 RepID=A0A8J7MTW9_9RHOB|nr:hypothetical protein [Fuscibacter oryzae]MBL4930118.1 hypothetical protein [Fuscibacter oryzae]
MRRFLSVLVLAGCSYVPASTVARLAAIDPLTADPAQIELAVVMPPGMNPLPGTAKMTLHTEAAGQTRDAEFALEERGQPQNGPQGVPMPAGAHAKAYGLSVADVARMRALQAEIAAGPGGDGRAALGVALGGCKQGAGPAPDAEGAVYVRLAADGSFLPLLGPAPLTAMLGRQAVAGLAPCPGQG